MDIFVNKFIPYDDLKKPTKKLIKQYKELLPKDIIDLWENYGFGSYGYGIVKLINPEKFILYLKMKAGIDCEGIPFMLDAFGNLFYYDEDDSVKVMNVEYNMIDVVSYSYSDFIKRVTSDEFIKIFLKKGAFDELLVRDKGIKYNEILIFNPPPFLGGIPLLDNVVVKDVFKYYDYIFPFLITRKSIN